MELDFWNGKNEDPIIYHGYTLVPEVPAKVIIRRDVARSLLLSLLLFIPRRSPFLFFLFLQEVIEAIAESAFKTSDYPVILSFENHCNPKQQAKIAQYCREYFGDMMLDQALESHPVSFAAFLRLITSRFRLPIRLVPAGLTRNVGEFLLAVKRRSKKCAHS